MRHHGSHVIITLLFFCTAFSFVSCKKEAAGSLEREKLFTLSYGRFEDEIDLFQLGSAFSVPDTQIYMRDGMFYIANPGAQKILQLTSFGDLLSVYYNPETNPVPSFADQVAPVNGVVSPATRKAIPYPFNHPNYLAVDMDKRLLVADQLPESRYEFDADQQLILKNVILRFTSDGRYIDYLGQEGLGGTPFPPVTGLYTNVRNEIIVITKTMTEIQVFWYDAEGNLMYKIPVRYKNLPTPFEAADTIHISLERVIPDPVRQVLYIKLDYFPEIIDSETGANAGISYDRSCIYPLDVKAGRYGEKIDIPAYDEGNANSENIYTRPFDFLGITANGNIFLYTPNEEGYALEIMDIRSRNVQRRTLSIPREEQAYNAFMLSSDGILSALLATPSNASVVWWRTDSLIGEIRR
ncbi:hypothetical protein K7I13_01805 [Brucepastera parasyntrophica]|uniref:LIC_12708 family protein n=1 Tax=Brucepastera parasyntrophica TaxID=2880008 RepID=UPI002108BDED|nr:hypothetical protein [Brucepastera parasyntrophica]ULQ60088.1 hypothetical protein K7I13_01805 [Brucepastera parasyntrophica]